MEPKSGQLSSLLHLTETPLIGRAAECGILQRLLVIEHARLVSITGPGGVGKTRLALHVARQISGHFSDGTVNVFLASSSDHRLVPLAIARALGVTFGGDLPPEVELVRALSDRELLLVVDTFEHLLPAARLFSRLLTSCPLLHVLVTSRTTLGIPKEVVFRLAPLVTPPADERAISAASAYQYDAVVLFEERARATGSEFVLTDENAEAVAQICRKLDGLPLAIELAAARAHALPPKLMLRHLNERPETPGSGARDAQARHRTMRDAIAWSYDLLTPPDQRLFRALSVFCGSFTASQAIDLNARWEAADSDPALLRARIVLLARASLLLPVSVTGEEQSFSMLGLLREFGLNRLSELGEEPRVRSAHAQWVAAQLRTESGGAPPNRRSEVASLFEPLREEIRAAIAWTIREPDRDLAQSMLATVGPYWLERGNYQELRGWLEQTLELWRTGSPPVDLLLSLAHLTLRQGEMKQSLAYAENAYHLALSADNRSALARAALAMATAEGRSGNAERSQVMATEAIAALRAIGDERREAEAFAELAHLAMIRGDLVGTQSAADAALAYWQRAGEPDRAIDMLDLLSLVARRRGDSVRQSSLAHQTLEASRLIDDPFQSASALWTAAAIACERQRYVESARFYGAEEAVRTASGFALDPAYRDDHDASVATVRAALGARSFASNWEAGGALTTVDALTEATAFLGEIAARELEAHRSEKRALQSLGLTDRQQEVLRLVGQGRSDREIAEILSISVRTVSKHVEAILLRLDARTRSGAAAIAARLGAESSTHSLS